MVNSKIKLGALGISLIMFSSCATVIVPEKLTDDQLVSSIMIHSGLNNMIQSHFNPNVPNMSVKTSGVNKPEVERAIREINAINEQLRSLYQNTKEKVQGYIAESFTRNEQIELLKWYTSPLGKKIYNLSFMNLVQLKNYQNWHQRYEGGQVIIDQARLEVIKQIALSDGWIDYTLEYKQAANKGYTEGLGHEKQISNQTYKLTDAKSFEKMRVLLIYYQFQNLSKDDMQTYISILNKDLFVRFHKTSWKPIASQLNNMWRTIGSLEGQKRRLPSSESKGGFL